MLKRIAVGSGIVLIVLAGGAFFWAKSVLTGDNVRAALAAQVEKAIGQPVTIGSLSATIMPRVTVTLGQVTIGGPQRVSIGQLHVGTDFRALLSRRIEHARLELTGARIELPLPSLSVASAPSEPADPNARPPVELVSIDAIVLSGVEIVSGGRSLRGDIELVPQGEGVVIRKLALGIDQTTITATGTITDLAGPVGELAIKAGALNMDQLLAFVSDFSAGVGTTPSTPETAASSPAAVPAGMKLAISLEADSATLGHLTLTKLSGTARADDTGLSLDPVSFDVFGGRYEGSLALTPGATLGFRGSSTLSKIDVAAATAFGGSPGTITGRLSGRLDFAGTGSDPATVMRTVSGKARVDITNGVIRNLGLVNSVVLATSMRPGAMGQAATAVKSGSRDEPFSKLGASLRIAEGAVSTSDLLFESKDLILTAEGLVHVAQSRVDLKGRVQLSDELTKRANADLVRYTADSGRVTLPATVSGPIDTPKVMIDAGDMAKRALKNAVNEQKERAKVEATKVATKKLAGLLGR